MVQLKMAATLVTLFVCISFIESTFASGSKTKGWPPVDYADETFDVARKSASQLDDLLEGVALMDSDYDEKLRGGMARQLETEEPHSTDSPSTDSPPTDSPPPDSLPLGDCDEETDQGFARDCADLLKQGVNESGIYTIFIGGATEANVYCDMKTAGGGWTVFQKRFNGSENFYRPWADYVSGFGKVSEGGEYWLGLENLREMLAGGRYTLRVDMTDFNVRTAYAQYANFQIGAACERYKLITLGAYSGTAGHSFTGVGMAFSTYNQDNDIWRSNCAVTFHGAWWYRACHKSNLNGAYLKGPHKTFANGINWYTWHGHYYSIKATEMKVRPAA